MLKIGQDYKALHDIFSLMYFDDEENPSLLLENIHFQKALAVAVFSSLSFGLSLSLSCSLSLPSPSLYRLLPLSCTSSSFNLQRFLLNFFG